ncbi:MAG: hypothetical protein AABX19_04090 [Nanoarchaeota archaeon]
MFNIQDIIFIAALIIAVIIFLKLDSRIKLSRRILIAFIVMLVILFLFVFISALFALLVLIVIIITVISFFERGKRSFR